MISLRARVNDGDLPCVYNISQAFLHYNVTKLCCLSKITVPESRLKLSGFLIWQCDKIIEMAAVKWVKTKWLLLDKGQARGIHMAYQKSFCCRKSLMFPMEYLGNVHLTIIKIIKVRSMWPNLKCSRDSHQLKVFVYLATIYPCIHWSNNLSQSWWP